MISLLHPSRGRPEQAISTAKEWIDKAGDYELEWILSIDEDDDLKSKYLGLFEACEFHCDSQYLINNNKSVVEATNRAAERSIGNVLIYVTDDMHPQNNWGRALNEAIDTRPGPWLLKVDDCLQPFSATVLTVPIMSRSLYERLGYFWHPGYKSMFVDVDLYFTAAKLGALRFAEQIKIEHRHPANGKAENDETYKRSAANWNHGEQFYKQRKAQGFPV